MNVYKYFSPRRVAVLENFLIKATQPYLSSDPFDMKPCFAEDITLGENTKKFCIESVVEIKHSELYSNRLRRNQKRLLRRNTSAFRRGLQKPNIIFNLNKQYFLKMVKKFFQSLRSTSLILCFTKNRDNLYMWDRYADGYSGFVIEFDEKHSFFNQDKNSINKSLTAVEYTKIRPILSHIEVGKTNVFLTKHDGLKKEEELRMTFNYEDADQKKEGMHFFKLPPECITSIILGCSMKEKKRQSIYNLLNQKAYFNHVKLFQAIIDHKLFKLNFYEINRNVNLQTLEERS